MSQLNFYDMKGKKKFTTSKFRVLMKGGRRYAIAKAPSGIEAWRIISKEDYNKYK